jgi:SAM-dependent methyltransferase
MDLRDLVDRPPPGATGEPRKIPWHDPDFSRRMLVQHLDPGHDRASRRPEIIDTHVGWIFEEVLGGRPGRVLDLGCGPGLYTERLAGLGCRCVGIDFSPAAIDHARTTAAAAGLDCTYLLEDLTTADPGTGFDVVLFLFGEINVFPRAVAADLLARARRALDPGGRIVVEASTFAAVAAAQTEPPTWYTSHGGLMSPAPHLVLMEQAWDERLAVARTRFLVVDAATARVDVYGEEVFAYSEDDYRTMMTTAGFGEIRLLSAMGTAHDPQMIVVTATAPDAAGGPEAAT